MIASFVVFLLLPSLSVQRGTWNASGSYEYYVSNPGVSRSYDDALNFCNDNGGRLAFVKSQDVQEFIQSLVTSIGVPGQPYGFYIGLRDAYGNNTFVWDDFSVLTYKRWNSGEPSTDDTESCVIMGWSYTYHDNLMWYDVDCADRDRPVGFVCQRIIGFYWSEWSVFSSCDCDGSQQRNRTCMNSTRPGPANCTIGETEIKNQTCNIPSDCPTATTNSYPTTKQHSTSGTQSTKIAVTARETEPSLATTPVATKGSVSPSPTTAGTSQFLYIAIGAGGGFMVLLAVILITVCFVRRRKSGDKKVEDGAILNGATSLAETEYSTIPGTNVEAHPEGEYATMGITNSTRTKQSPTGTPVKQSKPSVKFNNRKPTEAGPTDEYATILNGNTSSTKDGESEYAIMKGGQSNTQKNEPQTVKETNEPTPTITDEEASENAPAVYAAVIPKANRASAKLQVNSETDSTQKPVEMTPIAEENVTPDDGLYSSLIDHTSTNAPGASEEMYDALDRSGKASIKAPLKIPPSSIRNQESGYEETIPNLGASNTQNKKQSDFVEEAMYSSLNDPSVASREFKTANDKNEREMYAALNNIPNVQIKDDQMYDSLKL